MSNSNRFTVYLTLCLIKLSWTLDDFNIRTVAVSKVAPRTSHIAWLRYVTVNSLLESSKAIQHNTIFYIFLPRWRKLRLSISSCSKLVGYQSERKLGGVHWRWEDQRNDMHGWDLTVTCEWFDFGSEMFLALIALFMVCNVSVSYW